jgi:hypothetical protein
MRLLLRAVEALEAIARNSGSISEDVREMRAEQKKFMEISQNMDPTDKIFGFVDKFMKHTQIGPR